MKKEVLEELLLSLNEVISIEKGELEPARVTRFPAVDVKAIRKNLNQTQLKFSRTLGVSLATLRNWEQGRRQPQGPAKVLLIVAMYEPEAVRRALAAFRGGDRSLWDAVDNVLHFAKPAVAPNRRPTAARCWTRPSVSVPFTSLEGTPDDRASGTA